MTTEELIAQLTELEAKATAGNWGYEQTKLPRLEAYYEIAPVDDEGALDWEREVGATAGEDEANAQLIVLLRNEALPALKALAAENAELRARVPLRSEHLHEILTLRARLAEATELIERIVDHFLYSVAAVPNGYGGKLIASARTFLDAQKEATNED